MPVPGLTIGAHIDSVAASRGLAPTYAQKAQIDSIVGTLADVADDGVRVEGLSLDAWIAGQLAGMNVACAAPQPAPASSATAGEPIVSADGQHVLIHSGSGSRWARRDDPMTKVIIGFAASDRAARVPGDERAEALAWHHAELAAKRRAEAATLPEPECDEEREILQRHGFAA